MKKNNLDRIPAYIPNHYKLFCLMRKLKRQTCVRIGEARALRDGAKDLVPDGEFISYPDRIKARPLGINRSAFWIDEDLSLPEVKSVAGKIEYLKELLRSKGLQYTSAAGMFSVNTYTPESEKRKAWENSWVIVNSGVKSGERVLDIGGASTPFVFYLGSIGCYVRVIDNDWSCCGMIYNTEYVANKMDWDIKALDRDISKPIPFPDSSFDRVFSICTAEHLTSSVRRSMMNEVARVLKPSGVVGLTIDYGPGRKVLLADKGLRFGYKQKLFDEIINPSGLVLYGNNELVDTGTEKDGFLGAFFLQKPVK